jgi:hypothetical protein
MEGLPLFSTWIAIFVIVFAAALAQGLTGFGFALVAAPLFLLLMDPRSMVVLNIVVASVVCIMVVAQSWRYVSVRGMALIALASIFGVPLGGYLLLVASAEVLKLAIAALVVLFAIPLLLGYSRKFKSERLLSVVMGFISGVLKTSTSLSGPPVVLFLVNQGWPREMMRASLAAYFLFLGVVAIAWFAPTGLITGGLVLISVSVLPAAAAGFFVGIWLLPRVNAELYRRIAILIVLGTGVAAAATAARALLYVTP